MYGQVFTYSPEDVTMIINDHTLDGFSDGTFIEVVRRTPDFTSVRAIRGRNGRIHQRDKSGHIDFSLLQTSPDNDLLSKIVAFDVYNQTGLLNVMVKDTGGTTALQFLDCYLEGIPNSVGFSSNEVTPRSWRIYFSYIAGMHIGGNRGNQLDFI